MTTTTTTEETLIERVIRRIQQFVCGLHGHDAVMHFEGQRISMLCSSCGYETPGWDCSPKQRIDAQPTNDGAAHLPLIGSRRIA